MVTVVWRLRAHSCSAVPPTWSMYSLRFGHGHSRNANFINEYATLDLLTAAIHTLSTGTPAAVNVLSRSLVSAPHIVQIWTASSWEMLMRFGLSPCT